MGELKVNKQDVREQQRDDGNILMRVEKESGLRDAAFMCYAYVQQEEAWRALPLLQKGQLHAMNEEIRLTDVSLLLWATGEYLKATDDEAFLAASKSFVEAAIQRIDAEWKKPLPHWLQGDSSGIFLTHLAIFHAALQSIAQFGADETGIRLLKSIRELVFAKFIRDGRVVSQLGDTAIHGDIIAAAIPFGMLGIEDRILIEALYKLEETLVGKGVRLREGDTYFGGCERPDLTCLLAWYYANKGDAVRAKELLAHAEALQAEHGVLFEADIATAKEPLMLDYWLDAVRAGGTGIGQPPVSPWSGLLLELAQASLVSGSLHGSAADGISLAHMPTGYDDPYVILPNERFPRHPEAGDAVLVRLLVQPFQASQMVTVHAVVNGVPEPEPVRAVIKITADGEKVWEAQLGPYAAGDEVSYSFALQSGGKSAVSQIYRFHVRTWAALDRVHAMYESTDGFVVELASGMPGSGEGTTGAGLPSPALLFRADASGAVRVTFDADGGRSSGESIQQASLAMGHARLDAAVSDGKLALKLHRGGEGLAEGYNAEGKPFVEALTDSSGIVHKVRLNLRTQPGHRWFGMGERFSHYDYSGQEVDQYVYNQYRDQGLKTYMPVPFAISSGGYSMYADTALYSAFRFQTRLSDLLEAEIDLSPQKQQVNVYLFAGEPLDMIGQFTRIVGKPALPPKWSFGPWMSSNNWDSQSEVMLQAKLTAEYEIPSTVLVIEQWSDEATFYIFNDAQYEVKNGDEPFRYDEFKYPEWGRWPNPKEMVDELHAQGLKVLLWQIPIHKCMYGIAHGQRDRDEQTLLERGYGVKNGDGTAFTLPYNWFKDCHIVDFTNPEASDWWFSKRKYLVEEIGVDGFKTDGGEFVFGHDLQFHDGSTGREMRNLYPNLYVGAYYDFVQKHAPEGGITFSRAGYTGAQQYPMHWAGDERSTFGAFRSSIIAGLSSGMSGISYWGWDLGGFHGDIPTAELFVRSAQMAAFCPVMQYHAETKGEFNQDRTPWNIAERTGQPAVIGLYKKYADIRMNLLPYIYDQAIRASRSGLPMMRAMHLHDPADPQCTDMISQYMFGESLLVAPVTEEGHTVKEVYVPKGFWLSLFDHTEVQGPRLMKTAAGLADIPVYIRQDSAVALDLAGEYTLGSHIGSRTDSYSQLCFRIYVVTELQEEFEDDLGHRIQLSAKREGEKLHLSWSGSLPQRVIFLVHQPEGIDRVVSASGEWTQAAAVPQLEAGLFMRRDAELLIAIGDQPGSVVIG